MGNDNQFRPLWYFVSDMSEFLEKDLLLATKASNNQSFLKFSIETKRAIWNSSRSYIDQGDDYTRSLKDLLALGMETLNELDSLIADSYRPSGFIVDPLISEKLYNWLETIDKVRRNIDSNQELNKLSPFIEDHYFTHGRSRREIKSVYLEPSKENFTKLELSLDKSIIDSCPTAHRCTCKEIIPTLTEIKLDLEIKEMLS